MEITKEKFAEYERVRRTGLTNMFDLRNVMDLSDLTRAECVEIMQNYTKLNEKWPDVRGKK